MPCGVFKITGIPEDQVGMVLAQFKLDNPKSLEKSKQTDGTWIVTATFDPCADGSSPSTVKPFKS